VLYFPAGASTASNLYGQMDFVHGSPNQGQAAPTAATLNSPRGLALDSGNNLYVADALNNRVLYFATGQSPGTAVATRVYGQNNGYSTGTQNLGGTVSANTLYSPFGIALDSSSNLYVADQRMHTCHHPQQAWLRSARCSAVSLTLHASTVC